MVELPKEFLYSEKEYASALHYLRKLAELGIQYTFPEKEDYPVQFLKMKEPPLFLEYIGKPLWLNHRYISIVGSREIVPLTEQWMKLHLTDFLFQSRAGVVSGGARGVDQLAHLIALKNNAPTIAILPSGLLHLYPRSLNELKSESSGDQLCFLTEFEIHHKIHKSHFYFRNRLIAALGTLTLVVQASVKSGSMLTVHHCLEMGKPVSTIPAHPEMHAFEGNLKLLYEGAHSVRNFRDLHDFWLAENWPN